MKICIIIPTLNEEKNIEKIFFKIKKTNIKTDIFFIDDNSTDNSQKIIKKLSKKYRNINYIFRKNKIGIGSAHKDAIKKAYKKKYDLLITMDADGTHDPRYLKRLIYHANKYDYVITSRFIGPGLIDDWPFHRKIITYLRHFLVKIFLGMSLDASGAYRCFYLKKIKLRDLLSAKSNDYAFFWEVTYIILKKKYKIKELPVKLIYRKLGKSKMKISHIINSVIYLFKILILKK